MILLDWTLAGKRIEAAWWGPGPEAAPTLVLLHEGLGSVGLWRDAPERLARATGLGVLAYSRLGYGRSDPVKLPRPLDYMRREAMEWLPRVLGKAQVRRCVLVGHSDGASIAAIYSASTEDQRIRGLVLEAPHFFTEPGGLDAIRQARTHYETGDLRERLARHHAHVDCAFWGWNRAWLDPAFAQEFDLSADVSHIRVPILAIQGVGDPYGTMEQIRMLERETHYPVDVVAVPSAKHAPHLEMPEMFDSAVAGFAARLFTTHEPDPEHAKDPR